MNLLFFGILLLAFLKLTLTNIQIIFINQTKTLSKHNGSMVQKSAIQKMFLKMTVLKPQLLSIKTRQESISKFHGIR